MRRWAAAATAACLTVLAPALAQAKYRGTDVWGNLAPVDHTARLADQYPLSYFGLDYHVEGPSVGLGGISTGDVPAMIAQFLASLLFQFSTWLVNIVLDIFDWAFSVDLLNGAAGALNPIGNATQALYNNTLGPAFMAAAIVLAGMWAMHKALVQRRFSDAASGIALSVVLVVVALVLIFKPAQTIGTASKMTNEMSNALLAGAATVSTGNSSDARGRAQDHLFETFVYNPWVVMEFGGLKHCVSAERDKDGFPKPVPTNDPSRRVCRDHLKAHGGWGGYAPRYLEFPPSSDERDQMYEAIKNGEPNPTWPTWNVDKADAPGVDIQQAGGAFQRLALAVVIFAGVLGAVLLLGMLAFAALLAQVIALALLAFAPAALLAGVFPGAGHKIFRTWLTKLGTAVFIKAVYSLVLAILIAVSLALNAAVGDVGYIFAFGLQAAFFWAVFLKRKALAGIMLTHRETTRIERTTREAVATPVATAAGVGWAGGVAAARRVRGGGDEEVQDEQQEHVPRPGRAPQPAQPGVEAPLPMPLPLPANRDGEVQREPVGQAEAAHAGREELAPALAAARAQEEEQPLPVFAAGKEADPDQPLPVFGNGARQPTIAEAIEAARQEPTNGRTTGQERAERPSGPQPVPVRPSEQPAQERVPERPIQKE